MRSLISAILFALFLLVIPRGYAKAISVSVVTDVWLGFSNEDQTGYYFEILKRVFPAPQWQLNVSFMPFARTLYIVDHQKADMVLSVYQGDLQDGLYSAQIVELDTVDVALTPEMAKNWTGVNDLKNKKVQAKLAYRFNKLVSVPMFYEESSSLLDMLNSLNTGRIDAVLHYEPSILAESKKLKNPMTFVIKRDAIVAETYFGFANTDKGQMLKLHFDREHAKLIETGEQARLFDAIK